MFNKQLALITTCALMIAHLASLSQTNVTLRSSLGGHLDISVQMFSTYTKVSISETGLMSFPLQLQIYLPSFTASYYLSGKPEHNLRFLSFFSPSYLIGHKVQLIQSPKHPFDMFFISTTAILVQVLIFSQVSCCDIFLTFSLFLVFFNP